MTREKQNARWLNRASAETEYKTTYRKKILGSNQNKVNDIFKMLLDEVITTTTEYAELKAPDSEPCPCAFVQAEKTIIRFFEIVGGEHAS